MSVISQNFEAVRERIAQARQTAGKGAAHAVPAVALLAVSKTVDAATLREAIAAGQRAFGENYIQEALEKITALQTERVQLGLQWHCIGPIQSNKTRLVAENFDWVQTVDRLKIAQRLSEQRPIDLPPLQICLQVNIDGAPSKAGIAPQDTLALAQAVALLPGLRLRGIMAIPDPAPDFASNYAIHQRARALFDALNAQGLQLDTLSIGMSADLEAAIAAGSTLVRVGTALFGQRR